MAFSSNCRWHAKRREGANLRAEALSLDFPFYVETVAQEFGGEK